jgi:hypothetical protein
MLDFTKTWLPYLYLYGAGGVLFLVGIVLTVRHKALDLSLRRHRHWFRILIIGFVWYAFIHAAVILAALKG